MAFVRSMGVQSADLEGKAGKERNLCRRFGADVYSVTRKTSGVRQGNFDHASRTRTRLARCSQVGQGGLEIFRGFSLS